MYASPRRVSRRDIELGVQPSREILGRRQLQNQAETQQQAQAFERFVRHHKVGDVVSARVIRSRGKDGDVLLECGLKAHVDDCLDHVAGQKVDWFAVPAVGQRIQVYVRAFGQLRYRVFVSIHTFTKDTGFNLFNAGYRSSFDGSHATFALLPWQKPWMDRKHRPR